MIELEGEGQSFLALKGVRIGTTQADNNHAQMGPRPVFRIQLDDPNPKTPHPSVTLYYC